MADVKNTGKAAATNGDDLDGFVIKRAEGGVMISQAGGSYKPGESTTNKGEMVPLRGWAMRTEPRKSPKFGDHLAMIVRLTQPTIIVGSDGAKRVQKDGEVDVTMVKKLEPYQAIFEHENLVSEIEVMPTRKEKLANGHDLWHFDFKVLQVVARSALASSDIEALAGLLNGGGEPAKSLPAGTA
jgi:hypothetical protein